MKVRSASPYAVQVEGFTVEEHMHNVLSDKEQIICKVVEGFTSLTDLSMQFPFFPSSTSPEISQGFNFFSKDTLLWSPDTRPKKRKAIYIY